MSDDIIRDLNQLVAAQNTLLEKPAADEIIGYVEQTYGTPVYKCLFRYNELNEIAFVHIYLTTTADYRKIKITSDGKWVIYQFPEDGLRISSILKQHGFEVYAQIQEGHRILYESFEEYALRACYAESHEDFRAFRDQYFNPHTMEYMSYRALFVVYKTKDLMEQAKASGEQQRMLEAYYNLVKKYDTYNLIKPDKHLLVDFNYVANFQNPRGISREYSELYVTMLHQP